MAPAGRCSPCVALAGCSSADSGPEMEPGPPTRRPRPPRRPRRLTMLPAPEKTLSGTLTAELQQSSRDVALGRFQVWITNGLAREIKPRRIVYKDALLTRPVLGGRLRPIPSGAYRGYTLDLVEPVCGQARRQGDGHRHLRRRRRDASRSRTRRASSSAGSHERCDEIAIERIADLEWTPGIEVQGSGSDAVALFRLTATPTGRAGGGRSRSTPWAARRCSPPPTATSGPSASGCAATDPPSPWSCPPSRPAATLTRSAPRPAARRSSST